MTLKHIVACFVCLVAVAAGDARAAENPIVVIETNHGNIKVELFQDKAPITVKNFLGYVDDKFYDGTIFHRVMSEFMIQGGGFTEDFRKATTAEDARKTQKKTKEQIKNEANNGLKNARGTLAMARTNIVDSATSQFFINTSDKNGFLDHDPSDPRKYGYCVFGRVIEGMDIVDKIQKVKVIEEFIKVGVQVVFGHVPEANVIIKSIKRVEKK
jgi:cyclophilin family peptidyl-prolyl cis-trans isomerase